MGPLFCGSFCFRSTKPCSPKSRVKPYQLPLKLKIKRPEMSCLSVFFIKWEEKGFNCWDSSSWLFFSVQIFWSLKPQHSNICIHLCTSYIFWRITNVKLILRHIIMLCILEPLKRQNHNTFKVARISHLRRTNQPRNRNYIAVPFSQEPLKRVKKRFCGFSNWALIPSRPKKTKKNDPSFKQLSQTYRKNTEEKKLIHPQKIPRCAAKPTSSLAP